MRKPPVLLWSRWHARAGCLPPLLSEHLNWGQNVAQVIACLLSIQEVPGSILSTHKLTWWRIPLILTLRWSRGSGVQVHPWIYKYIYIWSLKSHGYMRLCYNNSNSVLGNSVGPNEKWVTICSKWDLEVEFKYCHGLCLLKDLASFSTLWSWPLLFNELLVCSLSRWSQFVYPLTIAGLCYLHSSTDKEKDFFIERDPWLPSLGVNTGIQHR